jgi:MFS family permease
MPASPPPNGWRTFLIVWVTQSLSVFGSALTFFTITIWLTQTLYPAPEQKGELAWALSAIAPVAGLWVDRYDRKQTMMAMDALSCVLSLLLCLLMATGALNLALLVILTTAFACAGTFHSAAFDTSYAMLVPSEKLPRANGMMQTIWSLSAILAPGIAAALIALPALARQSSWAGPMVAWLGSLASGAPLVIFLDAVTFLIGTVVLSFLFVPSPQRVLSGGDSTAKPGVWADFREGLTFLWHRRALLWLLAAFTVANFTSSPLAVFEPLMVKFNLAPNWQALGLTLETALAILATIGSIGGLVGGVAISAWGGLKTRRVLGVLVPMIVAGAAQVVFGLSHWLYLSALAAGLASAMLPVMNSHSQAIWQSQTPPELQGRVFAVRRVIAQFSWPLSTLLAGWLGSRFDPGLAIAALGLVLVGFSVLQLFNPTLRRVEDKDWMAETAARRAEGVA